MFANLINLQFLVLFILDDGQCNNINKENTVNSSCMVLQSFIIADFRIDCYLCTPYSIYQPEGNKCGKFGVIWIAIKNTDTGKVIIKELESNLLFARVYENDHKKGETHE